MGPLGLLQIPSGRLLGPPGYVSGLPVDRHCRPSVFLVLTPESSSATVRLQPINFYEVKRGDRKSCLYGRVIPAVLTLGFCWAPLGASWAAYGSLSGYPELPLDSLWAQRSLEVSVNSHCLPSVFLDLYIYMYNTSVR